MKWPFRGMRSIEVYGCALTYIAVGRRFVTVGTALASGKHVMAFRVHHLGDDGADGYIGVVCQHDDSLSACFALRFHGGHLGTGRFGECHTIKGSKEIRGNNQAQVVLEIDKDAQTMSLRYGPQLVATVACAGVPTPWLPAVLLVHSASCISLDMADANLKISNLTLHQDWHIRTPAAEQDTRTQAPDRHAHAAPLQSLLPTLRSASNLDLSTVSDKELEELLEVYSTGDWRVERLRSHD